MNRYFGIIKIVSPYSGFDNTGDFSGRIYASFNLEPRIGLGKEADSWLMLSESRLLRLD